MNQQVPKKFKCSQCSREFGRKDHLLRHVQRHSDYKASKCSLCDSSFSRRDALLRHCAVHGERADEARQKVALQANRTSMACSSCAKSKQRCQGGFPCARCMKKGLRCAVDQKRNNRCPSDTGSEDRSLNLDSSHITDSDGLDNARGKSTSHDHSIDRKIEALSAVGEGSFPSHTTITSRMPSPGIYVSDWCQRSLFFRPTDTTNHGTGTSDVSCIGFNHDQQLWAKSNNFTDFPSSPLQWIQLDNLPLNEEAPYEIFQAQTLPSPRQETVLNMNEVHALSMQTTARPGTQCQNIQSPEQVSILSGPESRLPNNTPGFPTLLLQDREILVRDNFCHLQHLSATAYANIHFTFANLGSVVDSDFPPIEIFHSFAELYFEYFDPDFPCVHPQQIEEDNSSWILLLAVASVGAQYSMLSNGNGYVKCLQYLLEEAIKNNTPYDTTEITVDFVQSVFIRDINLTFGGFRSGQIKLQYGRNLLFTLQRNLRSGRKDCHRQHNLTPSSSQEDWLAWLKVETFIRLDYCIDRLQCLHFALFELHPITAIDNSALQSLSTSVLWRSRSFADWLLRQRNPKDGAGNNHFSNSVLLAASMTMEKLEGIHKVSKEVLNSRLMYEYTNIADPSSFATLVDRYSPELRAGPRLTTNLIDESVERHLFSDCNEHGQSGMSYFNDSSLHIMAILRRTNLRALYAFSGWEADDYQVQEAKIYLLKWIRSDSKSLKQCLWHAASVFRALRNKSQFSCFDPFHILVATLVIWTYCMLESDTGSENTQSKLPSESLKAAFRIDLLGRPGLQDWLQDPCQTIHLTGLGILRGSKGAKRLMSELHKVLLSRVGWTEACHSIAFAIEQVLNGKKPCFRDDQEQNLGMLHPQYRNHDT